MVALFCWIERAMLAVISAAVLIIVPWYAPATFGYTWPIEVEVGFAVGDTFPELRGIANQKILPARRTRRAISSKTIGKALL